jgi:hypothetical protein
MCRVNYLLSSRRLPPVKDDPKLPSLRVEEVPAFPPLLQAIRSVAPAAFIYSVSPARLCGCYFAYQDRSSFADACDDKAQALANVARYGEDQNAWFDRECRDAVHSLGRYVARHAAGGDLAFYVAWESAEGAELERRDTVTPAFFGGASFGPVPDNSLLTIVPGL